MLFPVALNKFAVHVSGKRFNMLAELFDEFGQPGVLLKQFKKLF